MRKNDSRGVHCSNDCSGNPFFSVSLSEVEDDREKRLE